MLKSRIIRLLSLAVLMGLVYFLFNTVRATYTPNLSVAPDSLVFTRGCVEPDSSCFRILLKFPVVQGKRAARIQKMIAYDYLKLLSDSTKVKGVNQFKEVLTRLTESYDSAYVDYLSLFPGSNGISWYLNADYEVLLNDGKVLTIQYRYEDYLGGAHGMYGYHYQNIDLRKSRPLSLNDIVSNTKQFSELAEKLFKGRVGVDHLNGYWFEGGKFSLPREFGLSENGIVLHYNVYEIASFADGDLVFEIPYSSMGGMLSKRFRYLAEEGK